MRWSVTLPSPTLVAGGQPLTLGPDAAGRTAEVTTRIEGDHLVVSVQAKGLEDPGERPDHEEWTARAHLCVYLNPGNDHATRWLFVVDDRGDTVSEAHVAIQGEELGDGTSTPLNTPPPAAKGSFEYTNPATFAASLHIPTQKIFARSHVPVGIAIRVGFHEIPIPDSLAWPEPVAWTRENPLVFGDCYAGPPAIAVTELIAEEPTWGGAPSTLLLKLHRSEDAPSAGSVRIQTVFPGDSKADQPSVPWESKEAIGSESAIEIPVTFSYRAKWANGMGRIARMLLTICDPVGEPLWQGEYPFSIDFGLIVRERFGGRVGRPAPRPGPSDPDFLDGFRSFILTRIPDYVLKTTRQGAPSDFYLEDPDGEASVDLSAEDALERVAAMIAERFPDWQDALCASAMWVHHPCITRHSSSWNRISNVSSIETIPRLGGCFCGDTARLTAALSEHVGRCLGVPLTGFSMGLRGHLGTLVETPIGRVVTDGMLGLWFHTLDNERLATLEEMRTCEEISKRVWYAPDAHGHGFFFEYDTQLIRPWKSGPLVWPT